MAPEETERGGVVTERSDLYSLGLVLYELVTGAPPFDAPDLDTLLELQRSAAPEPPSRLVPDVDARARGPDPRIARQGSGEAAESAARSILAALAETSVGADRGQPIDASDGAPADRGAGLQLEAPPGRRGRRRLGRAGAHLPGALHASCRLRGGRVASTSSRAVCRALRGADRHRAGRRERGARRASRSWPTSGSARWWRRSEAR